MSQPDRMRVAAGFSRGPFPISPSRLLANEIHTFFSIKAGMRYVTCESPLEADAVYTQPAAGRDIPTDLTAVAARLVRELSDAARARGQQIRLECPPRPVDVPMSAALEAVLLRNLLDNALRYGPDGGKVAVQLLPAQATHGVRLCVEDAGPGLSDADLARLGERFFRVLGSGQSGSGLGWSIVRRLARLHALQLHIDRSPALGGLRVTVDWPRA